MDIRLASPLDIPGLSQALQCARRERWGIHDTNLIYAYIIITSLLLAPTEDSARGSLSGPWAAITSTA